MIPNISYKQNCGNCEHWIKETKDCECPVLFPDATIYSSVSEGYKSKMSASDGESCPTHKMKIKVLNG